MLFPINLSVCFSDSASDTEQVKENFSLPSFRGPARKSSIPCGSLMLLEEPLPALTCAAVSDLPAHVVPRLIGGKGDGHGIALGFNPAGQCLPTEWAVFCFVCSNLKVERYPSPQDLPGQGEVGARGTRP